MPLLSREKFVDICTQAILKTRADIEIGNQLSGYKKYHRELKENNYFSTSVRGAIHRSPTTDFTFNHDIIAHAGLGHCQELADYLIIEIARAIQDARAHAILRTVASCTADHVYLEIKIQLENERELSRWEVDAWDPRIIDISTREDGSIKNRGSLDYGYEVDTIKIINTDYLRNNKKRKLHNDFLSEIRKPAPGKPSGGATPEREMLDKHKLLYDDYTLEEAYDAKKLDPQGKIHSLQRVSFWQQSRPHKREGNERHYLTAKRSHSKSF